MRNVINPESDALVMTLIEEMIKEVRDNPDLARELFLEIVKVGGRGLLEAIFGSILSEISSVREEQAALREDFNKMLSRMESLAEEQAALREDFNKMLSRMESPAEEQTRLRQDFKDIMNRIENIYFLHKELRESVSRLWGAVIRGFEQMRRVAGLSLEELMRVSLSAALRNSGDIPPEAELRREVVGGEEINLFLEDPLIVGEVASYADSVEELEKLERKAEAVMRAYGRPPRMKILVVAVAPRDVARDLRSEARTRGVWLLLGKEV